MTEIISGCNEVTLKCSAMELDQLLYNTVVAYSDTKDSTKCLETIAFIRKTVKKF
jgi:hypothetical protein